MRRAQLDSREAPANAWRDSPFMNGGLMDAAEATGPFLGKTSSWKSYLMSWII